MLMFPKCAEQSVGNEALVLRIAAETTEDGALLNLWPTPPRWRTPTDTVAPLQAWAKRRDEDEDDLDESDDLNDDDEFDDDDDESDDDFDDDDESDDDFDDDLDDDEDDVYYDEDDDS